MSERTLQRAPDSPDAGAVTIIGCGLIGTSIACALQRCYWTVYIQDIDPGAQATALDMCGAQPWTGQPVDLVIIATPVAAVADAAQAAHEWAPDAVFTDVASVKGVIADEMATTAAGARYVGGHPLAGKAQSGSAAADADLFRGRPWVLTPVADTDVEVMAMVSGLVADCGAVEVHMSADEHDQVVATTSHLVQVASSALAGRLLDLQPGRTRISGPALADVTRVAASDADLWLGILSANREAVVGQLRGLVDDLVGLATALEDANDEAVLEFLRRGQKGRHLLVGDMPSA